MYNLCHYYYVYAIISLIKSDYKVDQNVKSVSKSNIPLSSILQVGLKQ